MKRLVWLVLGVLFVTVGVLLMWEFIYGFMKLVLGIIILVIGIHFISEYAKSFGRSS